MRGLSSHGDCQCSYAILAGNAEWLVMQNVVNEVAHFDHVGISESRQEVVCQVLYAAAGAQKDHRCLLERTNEDGALRSDNLGSHVIAVDGLLVGFDIADGALPELNIHYASDHV